MAKWNGFGGSEEVNKFVDCHTGGADQGAQGSNRELFMLRNRQIGSHTLPRKHAMNADLPVTDQPARSNAFTASFPEMLASLPMHRT